MQPFCAGLGQAIGQRLEENGVVIVQVRLEAGYVRIDADAGVHCKRTDPILASTFTRRDEIGEAEVGAIVGLLRLLPQAMQDGRSGFRRKFGVIPDRPRRPQPGHRARAQPAFADDGVEHGLGIGEQLARLAADHRVVQYLRVASGQFPGLEERRPIDDVSQFGKRYVIEYCDAWLAWRWWLVFAPSAVETLLAGSLQ